MYFMPLGWHIFRSVIEVIAFRPSLQRSSSEENVVMGARYEILGRSSNRHKEGPQRSSSSCAARTPPDAAMDPVIDEVKVLNRRWIKLDFIPFG
jgi:hypothetical protein